MTAKGKVDLKQFVKRQSARLGANLIGFTNVERWEEYAEIDKLFYPQSIWPWSKSVIVLGIQIYPPMLETTPSVVYSDLYNTSNRILDDIGYKVANVLNQKGYRAFFFPRDCYGDISVLIDKPEAAFSHVIAGKYAGLGTIGYNHMLLTKEYGPRVRLVSVITDAALTPDKIIEKDLCTKCELCKKHCPTQAFTTTSALVSDMDKYKCSVYHKQLRDNHTYPCGVCIKVCPIGADRKIYGKTSITQEGIEHCRSFGSK